jgi:hypothetical protein
MRDTTMLLVLALLYSDPMLTGALPAQAAPMLADVEIVDAKAADADVTLRFRVADTDRDFEPDLQDAVSLGLICANAGFSSTTFGKAVAAEDRTLNFRARQVGRRVVGDCDLTLRVKDKSGQHSEPFRRTVTFSDSQSASVPVKPGWTIVSAEVQRYTMTDRVDSVDPVVREGTVGLRILVSLRYDGAGKGVAPVPKVTALPAGTELEVPGNVSTGMDDIGSISLFMSGATKSDGRYDIPSGRVFGAKEPVTFYVVDAPPAVSLVRLTIGDSLPKDVKVVVRRKK